MITNRAPQGMPRACFQNLDRGIASMESGASQEYVAFDIREAAAALAEITG